MKIKAGRGGWWRWWCCDIGMRSLCSEGGKMLMEKSELSLGRNDFILQVLNEPYAAANRVLGSHISLKDNGIYGYVSLRRV